MYICLQYACVYICAFIHVYVIETLTSLGSMLQVEAGTLHELLARNLDMKWDSARCARSLGNLSVSCIGLALTLYSRARTWLASCICNQEASKACGNFNGTLEASAPGTSSGTWEPFVGSTSVRILGPSGSTATCASCEN